MVKKTSLSAFASVSLVCCIELVIGNVTRSSMRDPENQNFHGDLHNSRKLVYPRMDPNDCKAKDLSNTLHTRPGREDPEVIKEWAWYNDEVRRNATKIMNRNDYLDVPENDIFIRIGGNENLNFVYWGSSLFRAEVSAVTPSKVFTDSIESPLEGHKWRFVDPVIKQRESPIKNTVTLADGANYVIMSSLYLNQYQHILIDHLGYLAYLREKLPPDARFLLPQSSVGKHVENILSAFDPQFRDRVVFLECFESHACNYKIKIRNGGSITLFNPPMESRDPVLLSLVREWFLTTYVPPPQVQTEKTVIYYMRQAGRETRHGRIMDPEQELRIIREIQHFMNRFNRPERLVVFDGTIPIKEQIDLFLSATVIIGPHGGGLANLLFTSPGETCRERPKVVEFITSKATDSVQHGNPRYTFYYFFQSMPWIELHNVFFTEDSTGEVTLVNEENLYDALLNIFSRSKKNGKGHRANDI